MTWIVILVIAAVFVALVLMMMAFTYPELLAKGGKAIWRPVRRLFGHPAGK